jgi:hypothetical protein
MIKQLFALLQIHIFINHKHVTNWAQVPNISVM